MIVAPHTSGWDFIYGAGAKLLLGFDAKYLAKKELFKWPLKGMFLRLGGVPVDRGKHNGMVEAMIDYLNTHEHAIVVFSAGRHPQANHPLEERFLPCGARS